MLETSPKTALPDVLQFLRALGTTDSAPADSQVGPSFQDLLDQALDANADDTSLPVDDSLNGDLNASAKAVEVLSMAGNPAELPNGQVKALNSSADLTVRMIDPGLSAQTVVRAKTAAKPVAQSATIVSNNDDHQATTKKNRIAQHQTAEPPINPQVIPNAVTKPEQLLPALVDHHQASSQLNARPNAKGADVKVSVKLTGPLQPTVPTQSIQPPMAPVAKAAVPAIKKLTNDDSKAQEAAQKLAAIANPVVAAVPHTLQDALTLIQDVAKKLGFKDLAVKPDARLAKVEDRKPTRLDVLRNDLKLQAREGNFRVEVAQVPAAAIPTALKNADGSGPVQLIQYLKTDDGLKPAKDLVLFNPASPQLVMHHSVDLPAGVPSTVANLTKTLQSQLKGTLNADMVGQAKIMLSGRDNGEIRLVLHPEQLGEVRIHLKLAENTIGGTIYVDDKNVLEVFKDNMADLQQAFRDGGLDASNLQLAVFDGRGDTAAGGRQDRDSDDKTFVKYAKDVLESSVPPVEAYTASSSLVNLMV
jgi:hypothetical protein